MCCFALPQFGQFLSRLTFSTTSPSRMFPSLAARLSGEMSFTKMWLASRRPYSVFKGDNQNRFRVTAYLQSEKNHFNFVKLKFTN